MTNFQAISMCRDIGPKFNSGKIKREHYTFVQNETCSLMDSVYRDKADLQKKKMGYRYENPQSVQTLPEKNTVIKAYRKMIREHLERRVLFFFQQIIVCYRTGFHFESVGAMDQAQSADAIFMKIKKKRKYAVRNAAHSAANPCLVAYDDAKWQKGENVKGRIFLKGTDYYRTVNATMNMPRWINVADLEIDGPKETTRLQGKGTALINRASKGEISPDEGLMKFIRKALEQVISARNRLKEKEKHLEVQEVLSYYEKYLGKIQTVIEKDPKFLGKFLNIENLEKEDEGSKRTILNLRYAAIRDCQLKQSKLIQKIETTKKKVLEALKNGNRKPDNFDAAWKTALIKKAPTKKDRVRFKKLFNFSPFGFEAQLKTAAKTRYLTTKDKLANHEKKISSLARSISDDMEKFKEDERSERARIVKKLRQMRGWSREELRKKIKDIYPPAREGRFTITKIEEGKEPVSKELARRFADVFNIGQTLFLPKFYYR